MAVPDVTVMRPNPPAAFSSVPKILPMKVPPATASVPLTPVPAAIASAAAAVSVENVPPAIVSDPVVPDGPTTSPRP